MNQAQMRRKQSQAISFILTLITLVVVGRLAGYNGVAYMAAALESYAVLCIAVCGGISDVLGRILRVRMAKSQYRNAEVMRKNALVLQAFLGLFAAAALFLGAEKIAVGLFRMQYSSVILMILAPAVFLRALSSLLIGYSKGNGSELSAIAAGLARQIFILLFSLVFSRLLGNYGEKVSFLLAHANFRSMYSGIGVAMAVTLTELGVVFFLFLSYQVSRRRSGRAAREGMRAADSFPDSAKILFRNRGPQTGMLLLAVLWIPLGMIFWQWAAADGQTAAVEYGVCAAGYGAACGIAVGVIMLFLLPVCVHALSLLRKEELRFARNVFQNGVHMGAAQGIFFSSFMTVMSDQIGAVFCGEQAAAASKLLRGGSFVVFLAALSMYFARLLILTGKKYLVMGTVAVADIICVVSVILLIKGGKAGILSLAYGTLAAGGVLCIALGMFVYRVFRQKMDWLHVLAVPAGMAALSGFVGLLLGKALTPHLGSGVTLFVCLVLCGALYWTGLLLLRNFHEQELETLPGGRLLYALGQLLRVF